MKKTLLVLISIFIVLLIIAITFVNKSVNLEKSVITFNSNYEKYLNKTILGTDVATLIGKAIDNNEKYNISKDENGVYTSDNKYSIKIFINILGSSKTYDMETINRVGIQEFISNFNVMTFTCNKINYHEQTKRVSEIYIQEFM